MALYTADVKAHLVSHPPSLSLQCRRPNYVSHPWNSRALRGNRRTHCAGSQHSVADAEQADPKPYDELNEAPVDPPRCATPGQGRVRAKCRACHRTSHCTQACHKKPSVTEREKFKGMKGFEFLRSNGMVASRGMRGPLRDQISGEARDLKWRRLRGNINSSRRCTILQWEPLYPSRRPQYDSLPKPMQNLKS